jgi:protein-tyrosine phosphatase
MRRFVDLHCHFVAGIDDGAPSPAEGVAMLEALGALGFEHVVATPHMRPGMFENTRIDLERAFAAMGPHLAARPDLPRVSLSSEHYFDAIVFSRLLDGSGLPYPGGRAALLEFYEIDFPPTIEHRFFDLLRNGIRPVIAHPERYRILWREPERLERLVEKGAAALLDTAALVGKYGRKPQSCAEHLLELELYHAACSDAHRAADVGEVAAGMRAIQKRYGADEIEFLFCDGPRALLEGHLPE